MATKIYKNIFLYFFVIECLNKNINPYIWQQMCNTKKPYTIGHVP